MQIFCKYCFSEKFTAEAMDDVIVLRCSECSLYILTAKEMHHIELLDKATVEEVMNHD